MQAIVELELWEEATTLPFRVEVAKTATVEDIRKNLESTAPLRFLDSGGDGWRPLNEKNLQRMLSISKKVIVATKGGAETFEGITPPCAVVPCYRKIQNHVCGTNVCVTCAPFCLSYLCR